MHLFRRSLDISRSVARAASEADIGGVSRLFRNSAHRFMSFSGADLSALLAGAPCALLAADGEIWAAAIGGWRAESTTWLRGLALADGLPVGVALDRLLPLLYEQLRALGVRLLFYAGDEMADAWVQPELQARGYLRDTRVVVYEKRDLELPASGNPEVRVRPVQPVDLRTVLAIDQASFDPQWHKDQGVLGPAISEVPFFVVAELGGEPVGYAFATKHFGGRLVHLVRIAALPHVRGRGVGVRLLAEVVQFGRTCGADVLTLNTQEDNAVAQRLYEWFGFRRTGEQQTVLRLGL